MNELGRRFSSATTGARWAIVAARNEEKMIGGVIGGLVARGWSVVVVDDGSTDNTLETALQYGAVGIRHRINRGQGAALVTGIRYVLRRGATVVATLDADGQHDPDDLTALAEPVITGQADVAVGSRFLGSARGMPGSRKALLRIATWLTRLHTGLLLTDTHNGIRVLSADAAAQIRLTQDRMAYASEFFDEIRRLRLVVVEVPVHLTYTEYSLRKGQRNRDALIVLLDYLMG